MWLGAFAQSKPRNLNEGPIVQTISNLVINQCRLEAKIIVHEVIRNLRHGIHHELFQRVPEGEIDSMRFARNPQELRNLTGVLRLQLNEISQRFAQEVVSTAQGSWVLRETETDCKAAISNIADESQRAFMTKLVAVSRLACSSEVRQLNSLAWIDADMGAKSNAFDPWIFCFGWKRVCDEYLQRVISEKSALELTALPLVSAIRDSYIIFVQLAKEFMRAERTLEPIPFRATVPLGSAESEMHVQFGAVRQEKINK
jgi:hypothetical protein